MNKLKSLCAGVALSAVSSLALAAGNPLSVHVLNLEDGLPSPDVTVTLEQKGANGWESLNSGITNENGRITALFPEGQSLETGTYRVTFETGDWFEKHDSDTFFPEIPVIFNVDGDVEHYHIPLLLSPYGFSTYRGN
ncbi:hydroxyisourate hydrolase [Marinobacterium weihaiense]|uniref:5-hydroxyisourate hydrolase n=1 Tax=Marinobacterium weihaiense TaxID=2851016 RepID=A0ABS6MCB5_9GAMM|nr:hydroxyisourate hydrolase [Marinobacterium weihaiense]MBV0933810.1 hydroxyisourate hydrolase [Marinobacterium weihaiense]